MKRRHSRMMIEHCEITDSLAWQFQYSGRCNKRAAHSRVSCRGALESIGRYVFLTQAQLSLVRGTQCMQILHRLPPQLRSNYHGTRYTLDKQPRCFLHYQFRFSSLATRVRNSCRVSKLPTDDDTTNDKTFRYKWNYLYVRRDANKNGPFSAQEEIYPFYIYNKLKLLNKLAIFLYCKRDSQ